MSKQHDVSCRYNLTKWAIQLNEITPGLDKKLAPTDCRLRPDQHHLELGEYDQVSISPLAFVMLHASAYLHLRPTPVLECYLR